MSGIAGICNPDGRPVQQSDLERMVAALARRGPDGSGVWIGGASGLGHCMLQTTPESVWETLPLTNRTGDLVITADARIDNRNELMASLAVTGPGREGIGDAELILRAYEKWGEDCPAKLIGDFAFAVWDRRRQILFCARDHFGVKPFYYYRSDQGFVFGSEPGAILCLKQVPRRINEARIADYLVGELEGIDKTCTFYRDIFRLPPARTLTLDGGRMSFRTYWSPDPSTEIRFGSDGEYVEAFRDVFFEAVRCRLRSASPPASMLSGGMDSSAIVGAARKLLAENGNGPLCTFSAVSADEAGCAETRAIRRVLRLDGLEAFTIGPDQLDRFTEELKYVPRHADNLFENRMAVPQIMYIAARKQGIKVLLDGVDGDLVSSLGDGYLAYLLGAGMWRTALSEAIGYSRFWSRYEPSPWRVLYRNGRSAFIPPVLRKLRQRLRRRSSLECAVKDTVISPGFARSVGLAGRLESMRKNENPLRPGTVRAMQANTLNAAFITVALERYDGVASAYSVEPRHPFFDKRLVEFCLALPWDQKVRRGCSKFILRSAMKGILPEKVRWRAGKEHVGLAFSRSILALEKGFLGRLIQSHLDRVGEYVNVAAVREIYQKYLTGEATDDIFLLWDAATLALWLGRNEPRPAVNRAGSKPNIERSMSNSQ